MSKGYLIVKTGLATALLGSSGWSAVAIAQAPAAQGAGTAATSAAMQNPDTTTQAEPNATPVVEQPVATTTVQAAPDIVVTGTRRAQRLQDAPVAISVVSSAQIAKSGFKTASDLQYIVPTLTFNNSQGAGFNIRGFGSQSFDYNLEKAVSVVLDDVVQGLPRSIGFNTFTDVQRVEVLEGPQGTLFGKNASAGVVFVVTNKPELGKYSAQGSVQYGTDNETEIDSTVNVPISSTLAARISGTYQKRDGYLYNAYTHTDGGGYRDLAIRGKLLWQPSSNVQAITTLEDFDHHDDGYNIIENVRNLTSYATPPAANSSTNENYAAIFAQYGFAAGTHNQTYLANDPWYGYVKQKGISENVTIGLGDYTITSITAYKNQHSANFNDPDYTQTDFYTINRNFLRANQFSQEIRVNSPKSQIFDYVAGLFYYRNNVHAFEAQGGDLGRTNLPPLTYVSPVGSASAYGSSSRSYAAFGEGNLHISSKLTFVGGLRVTHDKVEGSYAPTTDSPYTYVGPTASYVIPPAFSASSSATDVTGKAALQYKPTQNVMVYASYARGYKAPAIGTSRGVLRPVKQENDNSFEAGIKSQWFDRRLTLNLTGYITRFYNFQASTFVLQPTGDYLGVLSNAPEVKAHGFELTTSLRATPDLTLSGNVAYGKSTYEGFLVGCYAGQVVNPTPGPGCYVQGNSKIQDATGTDTILAPRVVYNLGVNYEPELTERVKLFSSVNWSHRSSTLSVAGDPGTRMPAYGLLSGTLGVGSTDGRLKLSVYGRNLADKLFIVRLRPLPYGPAGSYLQTVAAEGRRTVGVRFDYSF